jgi:hypothetical protein
MIFDEKMERSRQGSPTKTTQFDLDITVHGCIRVTDCWRARNFQRFHKFQKDSRSVEGACYPNGHGENFATDLDLNLKAF